MDEAKRSDLIFDAAGLSPAALARKHQLERDPSCRTDPMAYLPGMEVIDSDLKNRVRAAMAAYDPARYTTADARRALEHERVTIVSHASGYIPLLYPEATIDPAAYAHFAERLDAFLVPPDDAADRRRVTPRLPDAARVNFLAPDAPLDLTPEMDYAEVSDRLRALRATNRTAALAPYAGHELGETESAPFVKAALERSPVSKAAFGEADAASVLSRIAALGDESIYDGPSRLAQPDETWNYGTGDGLEKCLLAANVLGGTEIRVANGTAALLDGERALCAFPTAKRPRDAAWPLAPSA